jgi:hypothetical protein
MKVFCTFALITLTHCWVDLVQAKKHQVHSTPAPTILSTVPIPNTTFTQLFTGSVETDTFKVDTDVNWVDCTITSGSTSYSISTPIKPVNCPKTLSGYLMCRLNSPKMYCDNGVWIADGPITSLNEGCEAKTNVPTKPGSSSNPHPKVPFGCDSKDPKSIIPQITVQFNALQDIIQTVGIKLNTHSTCEYIMCYGDECSSPFLLEVPVTTPFICPLSSPTLYTTCYSGSAQATCVDGYWQIDMNYIGAYPNCQSSQASNIPKLPTVVLKTHIFDKQLKCV